MSALKTVGLIVAAGISMQVSAADFEFDRPGAGMSTGITPVGKLAWEQALPSASYQESNNALGEKVKPLASMLTCCYVQVWRKI